MMTHNGDDKSWWSSFFGGVAIGAGAGIAVVVAVIATILIASSSRPPSVPPPPGRSTGALSSDASRVLAAIDRETVPTARTLLLVDTSIPPPLPSDNDGGGGTRIYSKEPVPVDSRSEDSDPLRVRPPLYYFDRDGGAWVQAFSGRAVSDAGTQQQRADEENEGEKEGHRGVGIIEGAHEHAVVSTESPIAILPVEHHYVSKSLRHKSIVGWTYLFCLGLRRQSERCLSPFQYGLMYPHQRINQFPGIRDILWKKDAFCTTAAEFVKFRPSLMGAHMGFLFPCFLLPTNANELKNAMSKNPAQPFIIKPQSRGEGRGIYIVDDFAAIQQKSEDAGFQDDGSIAQPLLVNPMLIDGFKFDLRLYVLVTAISPLTCYLFDEGLVRLAAEKYTSNVKDAKKSQFLTNTSVGKEFKSLKDLTWTFSKFRAWLRGSEKYDESSILSAIKAAIIRTLIMTEFKFHALFEEHLPRTQCFGCFQVLGVDVILDDTGAPKVIEVNGLPSMQLSEKLGETHLNRSDPYTKRKLRLTNEIASIVSAENSVSSEIEAFLSQNRVGVAPVDCNDAIHEHCIDQDDLFYLVKWFRTQANLSGFERLQVENEEFFLRYSHSILTSQQASADIPIAGEGGTEQQPQSYAQPPIKSTYRFLPILSMLQHWTQSK